MAMAVTTATAMVVNMILLMLVVLLLRALAICANVLVRVPCCVHQQTNLFGCADFVILSRPFIGSSICGLGELFDGVSFARSGHRGVVVGGGCGSGGAGVDTIAVATCWLSTVAGVGSQLPVTGWPLPPLQAAGAQLVLSPLPVAVTAAAAAAAAAATAAAAVAAYI